MSEVIEREIRVACSIQHAFDVFTGQVDLWWPRGHRKYEVSRLTIDPVPGGQFKEQSQSGEVAVLGTVIECARPDRIAYTWVPGSIGTPTLVEIEFQPDADGTLVQVRHSQGDADLGDQWPQKVALFTKGWGLILPAFQEYAGRAAPVD